MERLTGLDASFLYLETPSLHMHVAMTTVFDPSTIPGGYSFPGAEAVHRRAPSLRGRSSSAGWSRCRSGSAIPCGSTTPTSTSTTTCVWPPSPGPGGLRELAVHRRGHSRSAPGPGQAVVGDVGRRGHCRGAASGSSSRCTTPPWTGSRGPSCSSVLFDLEPDPPPGPASAGGGHGRQPTLPSSLELITQAGGPDHAPLRDGQGRLLTTGKRILHVRQVRQGSEGRPGPLGEGGATPVGAVDLVHRPPTRRRSVALLGHRPRRRETAEG